MDWTKIKTKHFLMADLSFAQKGYLVTLLCLAAHLERMPTEREISAILGRNHRKLSENFPKIYGENVIKILKKVLEDVEKVDKKRQRDRIRLKKLRENSSATSRNDVAPQIREDKIREDKSIYILAFENLWKDYPNKDGKKIAQRSFLASIKSEQDLKDIKKALLNYKKHLEGTTWKQPKNGSTWFNNWKDWVEWNEPDRRETPEERSERLLSEIGK